MKNIHIISTDKPSRLVKNDKNLLKLCIQTLPLDKEIGCIPQNIYITSEEEIKVGDFVYSKRGFIGKFGQFENSYFEECKKIILTTDQDLIKDGVQSIPDEFLEWFVKNPSCEEVEVKLENYYASGALQPNLWQHKIIIPKEEPKHQQERSYSEEEARAIWNAGKEYWKTSGASITFEELTEQFKKK